MTNFSNNTPDGKLNVSFKKHHVYEVATSAEDSKHIAQDYSNAHRYQHRATAMVAGYPEIRPYDPIYLDGLPNGLSGYWTVLSVKHIFGRRPADYFLELEIGTDYIGDVNPNAVYMSANRDIQSDLSNQSLVAAEAKLSSYTLSPNGTPLITSTAVSPTAIGSTPNTAIPIIAGITPYTDIAPNTDSTKTTVQWVATSSGKVIS
ncbi:hypothetical protein UFOVP27_84 [uncultured Caudovirales phage]|uniref:Uncharacterized protein n=1 Tax=uncultured Caudovirales phage TaxID=2100421 RepID=A0A6J5KJ40_9CAUD|nr:hypothetical protein UFOVP27_84 [uncultured Caudovirales phage]